MKKNSLILIAGLACLLLVGCGSKSVPVVSEEQPLTGARAVLQEKVDQVTGDKTLSAEDAKLIDQVIKKVENTTK
ncbi:MAG: hypothetical protein NTX91_02010 [candidate division SR1 bacterium]|nr:hypothetical protein [candidate division SR1 bacterium]